jgi:hypothetical protein
MPPGYERREASDLAYVRGDLFAKGHHLSLAPVTDGHIAQDRVRAGLCGRVVTQGKPLADLRLGIHGGYRAAR